MVALDAGDTSVYRPKSAHGTEDHPIVGDWISLEKVNDDHIFREVLDRRNSIIRKVAGSTTVPQPLAANLDYAFIATAMELDLNERRLERYIATVRGSGVEPVVILTKADLHPDPADAVVRALSVAGDTPVIVTSAVSGRGLAQIGAYIRQGMTVALLGSSGVGKSSLLNLLAGEAIQATNEVRFDGRGRHTTTSRRLVPMAGGGLILDTPGMRELQLWDVADGLEMAFADVQAVAASCGFRDCAHDSEPGCAVKAAVADGSLDPARLESYRKLERELRSLEIRRSKRAQIEERRRHRVQARAMRKSHR
ncbi:MAG: ribosome biosis GTPase / thiamine phosphate phosphatase [Actinomycetota bacterium]|jgi:ribosome biogenesis GTPase|nr:ribosome biosis GTPase / thiamine phosphate phosphatase [Actinomycetota bacterium]